MQVTVFVRVGVGVEVRVRVRVRVGVRVRVKCRWCWGGCKVTEVRVVRPMTIVMLGARTTYLLGLS